MPNLNSIIKVNLIQKTAPITQKGFGQVLFLSFDTKPAGFTTDVKAYTSSSDYATDFATLDNVEDKLDNYFSQSVVPERGFVGFKLSTDTDVAAALNRIKDSNSDWYCVVPVGTDDVDELKAVADWVLLNKRICFIEDGSSEILDTDDSTDIASVLSDAGNTRAAVFYKKGTGDIAGAVAGNLLPRNPGSSVVAYQKLINVTIGGLSDSNIVALDGKNANYFDRLGGQNITFKGVFSDGGFIDLIRDGDWIKSRIQENILSLLVNSGKIPFTEHGANLVIRAVRDSLDLGISRGVLKDGYTITRLEVNSIPVNDRANRVFPTITVKGSYQGGIQKFSFDLVVGV